VRTLIALDLKVMLQPLLSIDIEAVKGLEDIFHDVRMNEEQQDYKS
jgi:hypothetical protein